MEYKNSDKEMEVDSTETFSQEKGAIMCDTKSQQVYEKYHPKRCDGSKGSSQINDGSLYEDLSDSFMKLSVQDKSSLSLDDHDNGQTNNSQPSCSTDIYRQDCTEKQPVKPFNTYETDNGCHDNCTIISTTEIITEYHIKCKGNKFIPAQGEAGELSSGNCVTRSSGMLNISIVPEAENDGFNTAWRDKDEKKHLAMYRSGKTTNLDECLPHNARGNGGCCDHDHINSTSPLKITNEPGNISPPNSSLVPKGIDRGINSPDNNSSTTLKEKGYGTHSLHTDSLPPVKENDQCVDSRYAHSSSTLKSKYGVNSFPCELSSSQNEDNCLVDNNYVDSSSVNGYENRNKCRKIVSGNRELIYKGKKGGQVYKSDRYAEQILEGKVIDSDQEKRTELLEDCRLEKNVQDKWNPHFKQNTGQSKDRNLQRSIKSEIPSKKINTSCCEPSGKQGLYSEFPRLSGEVEKGHGTEKSMQKDILEFKKFEIEGLGKSNRQPGRYSKHEQLHHCEEEYPHTDDEKILQKHKNVRDDDRVKKPDSLNSNGGLKDKSNLKGNDIRDTVEAVRFNEVKTYKKTEGTEHNSSNEDKWELDKQLETSFESEKVHHEPIQKGEILMKQVRQPSEELWRRKKCQIEKELEQTLSNSDNNHRKRYERNNGDGESHHQRRKSIHRRRQQSSTSDSSDDDIDECLNKDNHEDKWDDNQNYTIPKLDFVYRKLSWESYLEINQDVKEWDQDRLDPFEQTLARCTYGGRQKKKFYRDFEPYMHHDSGEIRGWNEGEFVFIGEVLKNSNEGVEVYPESSCDKREGELTSAGGAIRKTYARDEHRNPQRSKSDTESDLDYGSSTESTKRLIYGLPPELLTEDETESFDEREDDLCSGRTGLQHQNRYTEYSSVLTRKSSDIAKPTESEDSSGFPSSSLVKYLTLCKNFSSDIRKLLSKFSLFENLKKFVLENPDVFTVSGNVVELRPKISLCEEFLSSEGCQNKLSCTKLHICEVFMVNMCSDSNCSYGHNVCTTHNKRVLQSFWMENLEASVIIDVLRLTLLGSVNVQPLDICNNYNFSTCLNDNCKDLHICLDYVGGLGSCVRPCCSLNHDIQKQDCMEVLFSHGIDITHLREEEQLLAVIQESIKITQLVQGYESQGQMQNIFKPGSQRLQSSPTSKTSPNQKQKPLHTTGNSSKPPATNKISKDGKYSEPAAKTSSDKFTSSHSNQGNSSKGSSVACKSPRMYSETDKISKNSPLRYITSVFNKNFPDIFPTVYKGNDKNQTIGIRFSTVWSTYADGDVEVDEICYYSVNTVCKFESSGCQRLHAPTEFHWQMKVSKNVSWINLQPNQVFHLEQKYTDPNTEITELPLPHAKALPLIVHHILKDEKHYVNLKQLNLVNAITFEIYELRRLHMQAKDKNSSFNQFLWYCKDIAGKWILFGNVDSSGDPLSAAKIKSQDIEKKYLSNKPKFHFKNSNGTMNYTLDFEKMVQVNMTTGKEREVRRRPKPHIFNSTS